MILYGTEIYMHDVFDIPYKCKIFEYIFKNTYRIYNVKKNTLKVFFVFKTSDFSTAVS